MACGAGGAGHHGLAARRVGRRRPAAAAEELHLVGEDRRRTARDVSAGDPAAGAASAAVAAGRAGLVVYWYGRIAPSILSVSGDGTCLNVHPASVPATKLQWYGTVHFMYGPSLPWCLPVRGTVPVRGIAGGRCSERLSGQLVGLVGVVGTCRPTVLTASHTDGRSHSHIVRRGSRMVWVG
jgi:hypothetical protein